jgi:hypothetical protein
MQSQALMDLAERKFLRHVALELRRIREAATEQRARLQQVADKLDSAVRLAAAAAADVDARPSRNLVTWLTRLLKECDRPPTIQVVYHLWKPCVSLDMVTWWSCHFAE